MNPEAQPRLTRENAACTHQSWVVVKKEWVVSGRLGASVAIPAAAHLPYRAENYPDIQFVGVYLDPRNSALPPPISLSHSPSPCPQPKSPEPKSPVARERQCFERGFPGHGGKTQNR